MTPCGDNVNACTSSGYVTQSSPKREDLSPSSFPLLTDYYARQAENEEESGSALKAILQNNIGKVMQAYQAQENSNTAHLATNGSHTSQVTTTDAAAPRMSIQSPSTFRDVSSQPLDLSTSKRPHSNPSKVPSPGALSSVPPTHNPYSEVGLNPSAYAAMLLANPRTQPLLSMFNGSNFQQILALAYMQNNQLWAQQTLQDFDMQKWITAVREHQLVSAVRQATKTSRKRTISVSFASKIDKL